MVYPVLIEDPRPTYTLYGLATRYANKRAIQYAVNSSIIILSLHVFALSTGFPIIATIIREERI